jgi:hypothetical protein
MNRGVAKSLRGTVGPNVAAISARIQNLRILKAIFSAFYNNSQPNLAILLIKKYALSAGIYFYVMIKK